jgi:hypothetical protein
MIIISHRGNKTGPNPKKENRPSYVLDALCSGYGCEVDVWYEKGWWLGHDKPQYKTNLIWLSTQPGLFVHCKNLAAMAKMCIQHINHFPNVPQFFWHETDTVALTNRGLMWTYPGKPLTDLSISVLPEQTTFTTKQLMKGIGICTDHCHDYKLRFMKEVFKKKQK